LSYPAAVKPKRPKVESIREPTLFEVEKSERADRFEDSVNVERPYAENGLLLGTSAFTATGGRAVFILLA
jgi:hypothetical protein